MTDSDENTSSRPISVAELLAKNGTIGAPVSGRRRRRRGNSDAVTVAELTGEIPVLKVDTYGPDLEPEVAVDQWRAGATDVRDGESQEAPDRTADAGADDGAGDASADVDQDVDAEPTDRDADLDEIEDAAAVQADEVREPSGGAEEMSPDPVDDDMVATDVDDAELLALSGAQPVVKLDDLVGYGNDAQDGEATDAADRYAELFGGQDHDVADDEDAAAESVGQGGSGITRGAWVVGQSVLAVAFGAGMFFAFDQLWRWNMIVALVLAVLVILGLVVGVRVVRKTDDLASTLIAVAVGALVTFGPLALLTTQ